MKKIIFLFISFAFFACQNTAKKKLKQTLSPGDTILVDYATGFEIVDYGNFKLVTVKNPWPNAEKNFIYILTKKEAEIPKDIEYDAKINVPIKSIVVTSTTHIPALEALHVENTLVGFPSLDFISSARTRKLIDTRKIQELGSNQSINTEILLTLQPDVVVGFAINGDNKAFTTIQKNGIPVMYNGDWTEKNPLGKAEWIKFFGALYDQLPEATQVFQQIEKDYWKAKELAASAATNPTVLSGAMYRDRWYLPYGDSWMGRFIEAAGGDYVYAKTRGNGSIELSFAQVLEKAQKADIWIAPGGFTSYDQLLKNSEHYKKFSAFQTKKIYGYAAEKGPTGGVVFYERAPLRPDLVLKDLIKIFHPSLLSNYEMTFFKPLP